MNRLSIIATIISTSLAIGCLSCNHQHHDHNHDSEAAATEEEHHHSDEIVFPEARAINAGVETAIVTPGIFSEVIPVSGRIISDPGGEVVVSAPRAGTIKMLRPWAQGIQVAAGTPIFTITSPKLTEGDPAAMAKAAYMKAKSDFERARKLYDEKLINTAEFQEAKAALEAAQLVYDANSGGNSTVSVNSPKGGYVTECRVKEGDYVELGTNLMTISGNRRMRLRADLPLSDLSAAGDIRTANFRLSTSDTPYELSRLNGKIISRAQSSEDASSFVPIIFEFDNTAGIPAGAYAEVYLIGSPKENVISIPKTALTEEQGVFYTYIRTDKDCYIKRQVKPGADDGINVEILSGLKDGEDVVVKGAINVKLASASAVIPAHTHNH